MQNPTFVIGIFDHLRRHGTSRYVDCHSFSFLNLLDSLPILCFLRFGSCLHWYFRAPSADSRGNSPGCSSLSLRTRVGHISRAFTYFTWLLWLFYCNINILVSDFQSQPKRQASRETRIVTALSCLNSKLFMSLHVLVNELEGSINSKGFWSIQKALLC